MKFDIKVFDLWSFFIYNRIEDFVVIKESYFLTMEEESLRTIYGKIQ